MGDADRSEVFDENSLRADIVKVWGEHGAHTDVFDHMLRLLREAQADVSAAARLRAVLDTIGDPDNLRTLAAAFDLPVLARIADAAAAAREGAT